MTSWTYDTTYQLTGENRAGTNAYGVDIYLRRGGNRLTRWDGTTLETWTYDAANQLTAILTTGHSLVLCVRRLRELDAATLSRVR